MTMIERVTKALEESTGDYERMARAAIEAMREPTEKMLDEGGWVEGKDTAKNIWGYMIDAALDE